VTPGRARKAQARASAGGRFRERFLSETDLDGAEDEAILDQVCDLLDRVELMERRVEEDGLMIMGSTGNMRPHGLLAEIRQAQLATAKLLAILRPTPKPSRSGRRSLTVARERAAGQ
jgi:hypothetical protein